MLNKFFIISLISIVSLFFITSCGFEEETNFIPENYGKNLSENWDFAVNSDYIYNNNIIITNDIAKLNTDFFNNNWDYRVPITINNSLNSNNLSNYQIEVEIDSNYTDFWNNIEPDGRSIRFIDEDNITQLNFWIEKFDYTNQSAIIWVKIPQINALSTKTIYLYYGNTSVIQASNGVNTFVFFDDFEDGDSSDWITYSSGDVTRPPVSDPAPPTGSNSIYSIEKINNSDPNGGYKAISPTIDMEYNPGYIFEGRIYRPSSYNGGSADRLAIEDNNFNGYGFIVNHSGSGSIAIERRDNGSGTYLGDTVSYDPPEDSWYNFKFEMLQSGTFNFYLYNLHDTLLSSVTNRTDTSYSSFNIVIVHGGYEYYIDDLRIRKYTSPEPTIIIGNQEMPYNSNDPTIVPKNGIDYSDLISFEHTLGKNNQGSIKYQISNDGTDWYYWDGTIWTYASNISNTNTQEEINSHLKEFVDEIGSGTFYFKAFLISNGLQQVELDQVTLNYKR